MIYGMGGGAHDVYGSTSSDGSLTFECGTTRREMLCKQREVAFPPFRLSVHADSSRSLRVLAVGVVRREGWIVGKDLFFTGDEIFSNFP